MLHPVSWAAVILLVVLGASPAVAQIYRSPSERQQAELRDALKALETIGQAREHDESEIQRRRMEEAVARFERAGPDAISLLREALQQGHHNPAYLIVVASLLVLAEGPSGVELSRRALEPVGATLHPDLFVRWLHICLRLEGQDIAAIMNRLLDIPPMDIELAELDGKVHSPALMAFLLASAGEPGLKRTLEIIRKPSLVNDVRWRSLMALMDHYPWVPVARELEKTIPSLKGDRRRAAVWALGKMDDERSVPFLTRMYDQETDRAVRREIIFVLGEMAHPLAMPALTKALSDSDQEIRSTAVASIYAIQMPESGQILAERFLEEKSALVRPDYVKGLLQLKPKGYRELLIQAKRKWPSFAYFIDSVLTEDMESTLAEWPEVYPALTGQVLDPVSWQQLVRELQESDGLTLSANRKTIVLSAALDDVAILEDVLPRLTSNLTLDHYRAFETYQEVHRLIRRKWRKDPRPTFRGKPVWYGSPAPAGQDR